MPVATDDGDYSGRKMLRSTIPPCTLPPRPNNLETARKSDVLHVYILDDKAEKVAEFINSASVPVDLPNAFNQTPLFCASFSGNERTVVKLLQLGADPNKGCGQFSRYTPVHAACYSGCKRVLSYLVEAGGDLRVRDEFGRTPRDWAEGYITRADKRMEILAVIESYRELANGGTASPRESIAKKSKIPRPISQILNLPHVRHKDNVPGPFGYVQATGFGTVFCGRQVMMGHMPVRRILEADLEDLLDKNDLTSGRDIYELASKKAVPYRCGEATTYNPWRWKDTVVNVRKLVGADLKLGSPASSAQNILIHELENLRELQGPGTLHLMGVMPVQTQDQISLVFERCQYGSLYRYLHESQHQDFTDKRMLLLLTQIANALKLVHNMGYVHLAVSSHSIHLVGPHQAKLGNFEFATKSKGDATRLVYTQRPWDTFRSTYWNWMSPEVLMKEVPSTASDSFSLCAVIHEVVMKKLPWEDRDTDEIIRHVRRARERAETTGEDKPYFETEQLPTYIRRLLRRGLSILPENRCELSEVSSMLDQQARAIFRSESKAVPKAHKNGAGSVPKHSIPSSSEFTESDHESSSIERMVTARDSGVFGTPEVPQEEDRETVSSSTSGSTFVQKPVKALVRKFSLKHELLQHKSDYYQQSESANNTVYHSVISSPPASSKGFSRRLSLPFKSKASRHSSSVDSAVKISVLPPGKKSADTSDSSWGRILNPGRGGILKLTKKRTTSPEKVRVEEKQQETCGATFYSAVASLDTVDSPPEPIYATINKVKKRSSSTATSTEPIPQPPPLPTTAGGPRKPASHFSAPNVFDPPAHAEAESRRPRSADEHHAYLRIPSEVRSVVAQPKHVIEKQTQFDRSEWERMLKQKNKLSCASTQTSTQREMGTQTVDFRQPNSSDELKRYMQYDSDSNSGGSCRGEPLMSSTPQKGALRAFLQLPLRKTKRTSVGSYDEFSRGPVMESSSPISNDDKKRCVSFFEPGEEPRRPSRGKGSKDTSSSGSMYETATEVSQPEKFLQHAQNPVVKPTEVAPTSKAKSSPPPPKPQRTFESAKPLVPYDDSVPASQNTSFSFVKGAMNVKQEVLSTDPKAQVIQAEVSEFFESVSEQLINNTGSNHSTAPTVIDTTNPSAIGWPDVNLEQSEMPEQTDNWENERLEELGLGEEIGMIGFEAQEKEVQDEKQKTVYLSVVEDSVTAATAPEEDWG